MKINEARDMDLTQLHKELVSQERALLNLRFRKATLQLSDSTQARKTRTNISRIKTVIRERQIVAAMNRQPAAPAAQEGKN